MAQTRAEFVSGEAELRASPLAAWRSVRVSAVAVAMGAWAVVFSVVSVLRHASFHSHRFDLGNMTQAVWSTAHGRFLEATSAGGDQFIRLGAHVDPLLALFALPWLLWPSPLLLLVVEAVVIAVGALPVYWLARKHTQSTRIGFRFALVYLLYPATQWNTLGGFHPISLAIPLLLFAIWYLDEDRLLPFLIFAALAATTKEQVPLLVAGLALWHGYRRRAYRSSAAIALVGLVWFVVNVSVVIPHFAPPDGTVMAHRYASIGGSPEGILHTLVTDPSRILSKAVTLGGLLFVAKLLAPLLGLSLLEPGLAACALPGLLICLLADKAQERSITEHYTANLAPFLIAAAVLGAARLGPARASRWSGLALAASIVALVASPLRALPTYVDDLRSRANDARLAALSLIPTGAAVASTNELGGHLSERRRVFSVPVVAEASWIVVDRRDPTLVDQRDPDGFARFLRSIEHAPSWRRVFASEGVLVFRRVPTTSDRGGGELRSTAHPEPRPDARRCRRGR
jgi:uncharacterized membrane protein